MLPLSSMGGGGKAFVAGPLKKNFFCGFPYLLTRRRTYQQKEITFCLQLRVSTITISRLKSMIGIQKGMTTAKASSNAARNDQPPEHRDTLQYVSFGV